MKHLLSEKKIIPYVFITSILLLTILLSSASAGSSANSDFQYIVLNDGTAEITKCLSNATKIDFPKEIDGYSISSIGPSAFEGCTKLTVLEWFSFSPVTRICDHAFKGCSSLEKIDIPRGMTFIADSAFEGCAKLERVNFLDISAVVRIGKNAFKNCTSIVYFEVPKTLTEIGESAFEGCESLKYISFLNEKNTTFGINAFAKCPNLQNIPKNATIDESKLKTEESSASDNWSCPVCGYDAVGNFCNNCGNPKPKETAPLSDEWDCPNCGNHTSGNFCNNCGNPRKTATPTPKPTAEPTPTPKPTATTEPTPTPKPTATTEPTPTPKPTATPEPIKVEVSVAKVKIGDVQGNHRRKLYVILKNSAKVTIDRVDFAVYAYDAYGNLISEDGYDGSNCSYLYPIKPGKTSSDTVYWENALFVEAAKVEIAIYKYHKTNGETIEVPENQLKWETIEVIH